MAEPPTACERRNGEPRPPPEPAADRLLCFAAATALRLLEPQLQGSKMGLKGWPRSLLTSPQYYRFLGIHPPQNHCSPKKSRWCIALAEDLSLRCRCSPLLLVVVTYPPSPGFLQQSEARRLRLCHAPGSCFTHGSGFAGAY